MAAKRSLSHQFECVSKGVQDDGVSRSKGKNLEAYLELEKDSTKKKQKVVELSLSSSESSIEEEMEEDQKEEEEDLEQMESEDESEKEEEKEKEELPPKEKKRKFKKRQSGEKKKRSLQYTLWRTLDEGKKLVKCRLCGLQQKFHLSNQKRHWIDAHKKEWDVVCIANSKGSDVESVLKTLLEAARSNSTGIRSHFTPVPTPPSGSGGRKAVIGGKLRKELALVYFLISTKSPFNILSDTSFGVLKEEWGVVLNEKTKIMELMVPMYEAAVALKEKELADCGSVSTAIDFWTSAAKRKYLAITYHGISEKWEMVHHLLDLIRFPGSTFAELIGVCVQDRIASHLPGDTMSVAVVSDRGGDVKKARTAVIDEDGEDCMNHRLNSALNDVFGSSRSAGRHKNLFAVKAAAGISYLISLFESDKNLARFFETLQEEEGFDEILQFVQKNDTRWEGLRSMFERFLRLKAVLRSKFDGADEMRNHIVTEWPVSLDMGVNIFSKSFFVQVGGVVQCLEPFSVASKALQDLKRPTSSRVPGLLDMINNELSDLHSSPIAGVKELAIALSSALYGQTAEYLSTVNNSVKAALVDPSQSRFVSDFGVPADIIDQCWDAILDECVDFYGGSEVNGIDIRESLRNDVNFLRQLLGKATTGKSENGLLFYRTMNEKDMRWCARVMPVVRMLLAIPAGESHCERAFSWAHGFITRLRTRTSNVTFEMQMVLYDYFKQSSFDWEMFLHNMVAMDLLPQLNVQ